MKTARPASHWFAILFFIVMALACGVTGYLLLSKGEEGYVIDFVSLVLAIVALSGLGTHSNWARIYCSVLLAVVPLYGIYFLAAIVVRGENVNYMSLFPQFIVTILMLVLFYKFAFGKASRSAFNKVPE